MKLRWFINAFGILSLTIVAVSISVLAEAGECESNHDDHYNYDFCYGKPCVNACQDTCCVFPCAPAPACDWAYNPPAYLRCNCNRDCNTHVLNGYGDLLDSFYYRSDTLWWRACEDGLALGVEEFVKTSTLSSSPPRTIVTEYAREKQPKFKCDGGSRIGIGNHCLCSCWDFALNWTHFRTKANVKGFSSGNARFYPYWERVATTFPDKAKGRYLLNLDLVDLEFGYKYYTSDCFTLRPQFGLRLARLHQSYRAEFVSRRTPLLILSSYVTESRARCDFSGVGPRLGLDMELGLGCGFELVGGAAGSILLGKFKNHARELLKDYTIASVPEVSKFVYEERRPKQCTSRFVTDIAIGLKWNRCFEWCNRCHPVSLALIWEHHGFFNMNAFNFADNGFEIIDGIDDLSAPPLDGPLTSSGSKRGNLFTQGLTFAGTVGF